MAIQYSVQAQVVEMQADVPTAGDAMLVDTNAWLWTCYAKATVVLPQHRAQSVAAYARYLKKCRRAGTKLYWCGLGLSELAHQIEKTEHELWERAGHAGETVKEFRHNYPAERQSVVQEIENAWQSVEGLGTSLPGSLVVDEAATKSALAEYKAVALDGYDLFFLQAARAAGVTQVVSDDGDFCEVPDITLFTSNRSVLTAAAAQGKLMVR